MKKNSANGEQSMSTDLEPSELDRFVEQATGHRETALELLNDPRADIVAAQEAQVHATLYLADMVAAVFATLPRDDD
jgi:hypothetical protein